MDCTRCETPMKLETEMKESGFWFQWFHCTVCGEGYLHKSPLPADLSSQTKTSPQKNS